MKGSVKIKLLAFGLCLTLLACYHLAIKQTLDLKRKHDQLENRVTALQDMPGQLEVLEQKVSYYDSILGKMNLGDTSLQNNLLRTLQQEGEKQNTLVMDFNQPHTFYNETNTLLTYSFDLKGEFANILKTIYALEQKGNFGEVVHIDFEKKKNYRSRKSSLTAKVFVQQIN